MEVLKKMVGSNSGINLGLLVGGDSISKQLHHLETRKPRIIVGTPGRINDHLERRSINFHNTRFLVLDETDRMLDMGFSIAIDKILSHVPQERQTLLFSATLPGNILKLAKKYLSDPVHIAIGPTASPATRIKQETIHVSEAEKYNNLLIQLDQREGSIIVFVKTKIGADRIAKNLRLLKHEASAIHGDLRQRERDSVIRAFRARKNRIMVATDVAARGLDIPHIEHVINYDLPHCAEDYIHRIGRTARAGAEGSALNLVAPQDGKKWSAIYRLLNPNEKHDRAPKDRSPRDRKDPKRNNRKRYDNTRNHTRKPGKFKTARSAA
jgi:superfamily II DNA/RNA helicase